MIVYDTGALIAAERSERELWALHDAALRRGVAPIVPAAVLAQAWRGGPQAGLSRLLTGCSVVPLDEGTARAAGVLCGRVGSDDVVDASVVAVAQAVGAAVVTGDADDLAQLIRAVGADIELHEI